LKNLVEILYEKNIGGVCEKMVLIDNENSKSEGVEETQLLEIRTIIKRAKEKAALMLSQNGGILPLEKNYTKTFRLVNAVYRRLYLFLCRY
jgi:hypothetical protein